MKDYKIKQGYRDNTFYSAKSELDAYCYRKKTRNRYNERQRGEKWLSACAFSRLQWELKHGK